jgi:hypothetical protein
MSVTNHGTATARLDITRREHYCEHSVDRARRPSATGAARWRFKIHGALECTLQRNIEPASDDG